MTAKKRDGLNCFFCTSCPARRESVDKETHDCNANLSDYIKKHENGKETCGFSQYSVLKMLQKGQKTPAIASEAK